MKIAIGYIYRQNGRAKGGFTLLELIVAIIIICILATLSYASISEIIFTNRAKETAQTIRTFTEKALMDAKRQNISVKISINGNAIIATNATTNAEISRENLSRGFSEQNNPPMPGKEDFINNVQSQIRIGLSGISKEGYFAACSFKGYCGGAVKIANENSLKAYIKKGNNANWEAL